MEQTPLIENFAGGPNDVRAFQMVHNNEGPPMFSSAGPGQSIQSFTSLGAGPFGHSQGPGMGYPQGPNMFYSQGQGPDMVYPQGPEVTYSEYPQQQQQSFFDKAGDAAADSLDDLDDWLQKAFDDRSNFHDGSEAIELNDRKYKRFVAKYGKKPAVQILFNQEVGQQQTELLQAITDGDLNKIRSFLGKHNFSWNFIYPPTTGNGVRRQQVPKGQLSGWCRSPLGLCVFPDDGLMDAKLPNVTHKQRLDLIRDLLRYSANPNYPPIYWATPMVLACLAGDVDTLELLEYWGGQLDQKVEFGLDMQPEFTLAHAAAMNGHQRVLEYLYKKDQGKLFSELDCDRSNPLHTVMEYSRDFNAATYLFDHGCDGFAFNAKQRSPLSMAIETMPDFAKVLLASRSSKEQTWLGTDLYRFSFQGVALPLNEKNSPILAADSKGAMRTIEEMIVHYKAKDLMSVPLMQDLLALKWSYFGRRKYILRIVPSILTAICIFIISTADTYSKGFRLASVLFILLLLVDVTEIVDRFHRATFWLWLDVFNLCAALTVLIFRVCRSMYHEELEFLVVYVVPLAVLLQVTVCFRLLKRLAISQTLGPLLIAVIQMVTDTVPWLMLLGMIILTFLNAFFVLIHFQGVIGDPVDVGFGEFLGMLIKILLGDYDTPLEVIDEFTGSLHIWGLVLFWSYVAIVVFMMLNLLIALYNTTYVRVCEGNSQNEWLFMNYQLMLEFESSSTDDSVKEYYEELVRFDGKRSNGKWLFSTL